MKLQQKILYIFLLPLLTMHVATPKMSIKNIVDACIIGSALTTAGIGIHKDFTGQKEKNRSYYGYTWRYAALLVTGTTVLAVYDKYCSSSSWNWQQNCVRMSAASIVYALYIATLGD